MKTERLSSDIISSLPENIIENILSLMPIRDALRTSVLSKKWRYCWQGMPKLAFTNNMIKLQSKCGCKHMRKWKVVNAIFHVFLLHNGPTVLEFNWSVHQIEIFSELDQIISHLSKQNNVKDLIFIIKDAYYNLPASFFLLQGLERIRLHSCRFQPPLTFNGFSKLRRIWFTNVEVSAEILQRFLSNCPLLEQLFLNGYQGGNEFTAGGDYKFTFVDLLQCVPLIQSFQISEYYMKHLRADHNCKPHKLLTSVAHLKYLYLDVCLMEHNEISSVLSMIMSSPLLVEIILLMYDNEKLHARQTPTNFLDPENFPDLKWDHLEKLEIENSSNLPLEMEFVKLIMAKSPALKKAQIKLNDNVSVKEELKMLRNLVLHPFPRASPSAKLIIKRPQTSSQIRLFF